MERYLALLSSLAQLILVICFSSLTTKLGCVSLLKLPNKDEMFDYFLVEKWVLD